MTREIRARGGMFYTRAYLPGETLAIIPLCLASLTARGNRENCLCDVARNIVMAVGAKLLSYLGHRLSQSVNLSIKAHVRGIKCGARKKKEHVRALYIYIFF